MLALAQRGAGLACCPPRVERLEGNKVVLLGNSRTRHVNRRSGVRQVRCVATPNDKPAAAAASKPSAQPGAAFKPSTKPAAASKPSAKPGAASKPNPSSPKPAAASKPSAKSAAAPAAAGASAASTPPEVAPAALDAPPAGRKKVVIVGAGWAGFGAAKHLSEQGYDVTVLDASPTPGGLSTGWRTPQGRAVEAGFKGFWYQYENIFSLVKELDIEWPFTPFTPSGFWSPRGLTTEAPVFSEKPRLPTLLGQFVWTAQLQWMIPIPDRLTMFNLAFPVIDYDSDRETYEKYDTMSAYDLFRQWGISKRIYEDFLKPTCLIGLFAPPEELSAGAVLGCFFFYALAHQADFDVAWCKGSVAERIFAPMMERIRGAGGKILGSHVVTDVEVDEASGRVVGVRSKNFSAGGEETYHEADAVVFAVGITGMQKIVSASPALGQRPEFRAIMDLSAVDVIATRMWFDKKVDCRFPANVLGGFEDNVGATFFDLNQLQDEYRHEPGSVIAADYYHAGSLMPLSNEEIIERTQRHMATCEPGFKDAKVIDSAVLRFPKAVTHFSPGSYRSRPYQQTSLPNMFMAGDWVKGVPHGANGLSQERAYVTGLLAANLVVDDQGVGCAAKVLDTEANEPFVAALKDANRAAKVALRQLGVSSPLL